MSYDQQTWANGVLGGTPLNADRLNHVEQGVADAHSLIADLALANHTHTSAQITDATSANTPNTIVERSAAGLISVSTVSGLTGATAGDQAVSKDELDAAIAGVSGVAHTHTTADITDMTATGVDLVTAVDTETARTVLDVPSNADVDTSIDSAVADEATARTTAIAAATDRMTHTLAYSGGAWPTRPNTAGTNQKVQWVGSAASPVPTDGTTSGGTAKAAPGDLIFYTS